MYAGYSTSLEDPSAAFTPNAAVCSSMTAFGTLHHLGSCSIPRAPSLVSRTADAVPTRRGMGDGITVRRAACIRALQPRKGIISSSFLSESIVQSELQSVGLVYGVSLCHALDDLFDKFSCFLCLQLAVQIFPARFHHFGVPDVIQFRTQRAGLMWFDTYWEANLEKVSVITFSSVNFAFMSPSARATSVVIWSYNVVIQQNRTTRSYKHNLPSSPACR